MINIFQLPRPIDSIYSDTLFAVAGFKITNTTVTLMLVVFLCALLCFFCTRKIMLLPGKLQAFIEIIYEAIEGLIFQITANRRETARLVLFIGPLFLFIAISNLLGSIPVISNITFGGKAIFRMPTSDFSATFSLALIAIIAIQAASIKSYGLFGHVGKFVKVKGIFYGFREGFMAGLLSLVDFFIGFLDIISEFARVISISLRLFGNMYAGMVLLTVISGMMAYLAPSFLVVMGLMFAVVQAVVFSSLVTVYYALSVDIKKDNGV